MWAARIARKVLVVHRDAREDDRSPRAGRSPRRERSTAESIPRPSKSILRKPASAHESLSHCTGGAPPWRPAVWGRYRSTAESRSPSRRGVGRDGGAVPTPRGPGGQGLAIWSMPPSPGRSRSSGRSRPVGPIEHLDRACHSLHLSGRNAERLSEVARRGARPMAHEAATRAERSAQ